MIQWILAMCIDSCKKKNKEEYKDKFYRNKKDKSSVLQEYMQKMENMHLNYDNEKEKLKLHKKLTKKFNKVVKTETKKVKI